MEDRKDDIRLSDIAVTLHYGARMPKSLWVMCWVMFGIFAAGLMLMLITGIIAFAVDGSTDGEDVTAFIITTAVIVLFFIIDLIFILRERKLTNRIKLWLADAVVIRARSWAVMEIDGGRYFTNMMPLLKITFTYNGKRHSYVGGYGEKRLTKCRPSFAPYRDCFLDIVYSPEYGEVMFFRTMFGGNDRCNRVKLARHYKSE